MRTVAGVALALHVLVLSGCTTAGPFVTNISSDGQGGIVVEKAMVEHNQLTGMISTKETTTMYLKLIPTP